MLYRSFIRMETGFALQLILISQHAVRYSKVNAVIFSSDSVFPEFSLSFFIKFFLNALTSRHL